MVFNWLICSLTVIAAVQAVLLWRATRALATLHHIEARVERFGGALTLLTDTTESAFRAVASEIARTPARPVGPRATSTRRTARVARAAARGQSIPQIAASEEMAEGEVRLRLQMVKEEPPARTPAKPARKRREAQRGTVRVE
jgi:hypothetical protein